MNLPLTILLPAFCASMIVLATHVPLGQEVLKRGIIFWIWPSRKLPGLAPLSLQVMVIRLWVQKPSLFALPSLAVLCWPYWVSAIQPSLKL